MLTNKYGTSRFDMIEELSSAIPANYSNFILSALSHICFVVLMAGLYTEVRCGKMTLFAPSCELRIVTTSSWVFDNLLCMTRE